MIVRAVPPGHGVPTMTHKASGTVNKKVATPWKTVELGRLGPPEAKMGSLV